MIPHARILRLAAAAVALVVLTVPASQAPAQVAGEPIDPDAVAAFSWSMPARYNASWGAWSPSSAR